MLLLLAQDGGDDINFDANMIIWFAAGAIFIIFLYSAWHVYEIRRKREMRPSVLIINLITRSLLSAGKFKRVTRNIRIPVSQSSEKVFWAVETDHVTILPAYGDLDDLMIEDERRANIKIMIAETIGISRDGESVMREWAKYAFPPEVFQMPPELDMESVPPNYVFVKPIYKREWGPVILERGLAAVRSVFGEFIRARAVADHEQEILHENYGRMNFAVMQSANEIIISMYYNVFQLWDTISEQRVLPWEVYGRLVHQPMDQLHYTGLQQAIQNGNIREIGSNVIKSFRRALDTMAGDFGQTLISTPMASLMMGKLNDMQKMMSAPITREYESRQAGVQGVRDLINMVNAQSQQQQSLPQRMEAPQGRPQGRPVVDMFDKQ